MSRPLDIVAIGFVTTTVNFHINHMMFRNKGQHWQRQKAS
jgi:hypothetical protein